VSFQDEAQPEPRYTSRLATRYRVHLVKLRTCAYLIDDPAERAKLLGAIQALATDLAMGFAPTERLTLEQARAADGVTALLDDTAPAHSHDRDYRPEAAE
jgi:hypothetical protein